MGSRFLSRDRLSRIESRANNLIVLVQIYKAVKSFIQILLTDTSKSQKAASNVRCYAIHYLSQISITQLRVVD